MEMERVNTRACVVTTGKKVTTPTLPDISTTEKSTERKVVPTNRSNPKPRPIPRVCLGNDMVIPSSMATNRIEVLVYKPIEVPGCRIVDFDELCASLEEDDSGGTIMKHEMSEEAFEERHKKYEEIERKRLYRGANGGSQLLGVGIIRAIDPKKQDSSASAPKSEPVTGCSKSITKQEPVAGCSKSINKQEPVAGSTMSITKQEPVAGCSRSITKH